LKSYDLETVEKLSKSIIEMAVVTKNHPYTILKNVMNVIGKSDPNEIDDMTNDCKTFIKSKESELPFIL